MVWKKKIDIDKRNQHNCKTAGRIGGIPEIKNTSHTSNIAAHCAVYKTGKYKNLIYAEKIILRIHPGDNWIRGLEKLHKRSH